MINLLCHTRKNKLRKETCWWTTNKRVKYARGPCILKI